MIAYACHTVGSGPVKQSFFRINRNASILLFHMKLETMANIWQGSYFFGATSVASSMQTAVCCQEHKSHVLASEIQALASHLCVSSTGPEI